MTTDSNSAGTIARLATEAAGSASTVTLSGGREFIIHPPGFVAKEVPVLPQNVERPIPKWTSQIVNLQNESSLTEYINRFKNTDTAIFADITTDTVVSIIDYHHEAGGNMDGVGIPEGFVMPALKSHRAVLKLPKSIEWETWRKSDEVRMSQLDFVCFLEDNAVDVKDPDGASLLELCSDLEATRDVKFGATVRAGAVDNLSYVKESGAQSRGKVALPLEIGLMIPVYFGDEEVELRAKLRRKVDSDGCLEIWYKLMRPENVRQNRFQTIVQRIFTETGQLTTIYGTAN